MHPQQKVGEGAQRRKGRAETPRGAGRGARGGWPQRGWWPLASSGLGQARSGVWPGCGHHDQRLAQPFGRGPRDTQEAGWSESVGGGAGGAKAGAGEAAGRAGD